MSLTFDAGPHLYRWRGEVVPSVTQVMRAAGMGPDYDAIPAATLERKGRIGTATHLALDAVVGAGVEEPDLDACCREAGIDLATPDGAHDRERVEGYVAGGRRFVEEVGLRAEASELRGYSRVFGYAGTVDVVGFAALLGPRRTIFDWKTTAELHLESVGAQTAGYEVIWNEERPGRRVERRAAVQLKDDGTYRLRVLDRPGDVARWVAAVRPGGEDAVIERARRMVAERMVEFT